MMKYIEIHFICVSITVVFRFVSAMYYFETSEGRFIQEYTFALKKHLERKDIVLNLLKGWLFSKKTKELYNHDGFPPVTLLSNVLNFSFISKTIILGPINMFLEFHRLMKIRDVSFIKRMPSMKFILGSINNQIINNLNNDNVFYSLVYFYYVVCSGKVNLNNGKEYSKFILNHTMLNNLNFRDKAVVETFNKVLHNYLENITRFKNDFHYPEEDLKRDLEIIDIANRIGLSPLEFVFTLENIIEENSDSFNEIDEIELMRSRLVAADTKAKSA